MSMIMTHSEFKDNGIQLAAFANEFIVECPSCSKRSKVISDVPQSEGTADVFSLTAPRKIACGSCGYSRNWDQQQYAIYSEAFDWYFGLPLWLQMPCCGETLWAFNERHLEFLESYFNATIRRQTPNVNKSLVSRLPKWMKDAKNREQIQKGLQELRKRLRN
jgi:hypothetical protein